MDFLGHLSSETRLGGMKMIEISRGTKETQISVKLNLYGKGEAKKKFLFFRVQTLYLEKVRLKTLYYLSPILKLE